MRARKQVHVFAAVMGILQDRCDQVNFDDDDILYDGGLGQVWGDQPPDLIEEEMRDES